MINIKYLFHSSCCGYYCLKHIFKGKYKRIKNMSLYEMKEIFNDNNYGCFGCKLEGLEDVYEEFITLLTNKRGHHYIVVKKIFDKYLLVYNPLFLSLRKMNKEKFLKKWTHICLFYRKRDF